MSYLYAPTVVPTQGPLSRKLRIAVSVLAAVGMAGVVASGTSFALYRGERDRLHAAVVEQQQLRGDLAYTRDALKDARTANEGTRGDLAAATRRASALASNRQDLLTCLSSWLQAEQLDPSSALVLIDRNQATCDRAMEDLPADATT